MGSATGSKTSPAATASPPPSILVQRDPCLHRHGFRLLAAPESFLIGQGNTLLDGEAARARQWGATLGAAASHIYAPAST
jgi:hypothetical protein